jgi:hypothetical protein
VLRPGTVNRKEKAAGLVPRRQGSQVRLAASADAGGRHVVHVMAGVPARGCMPASAVVSRPPGGRQFRPRAGCATRESVGAGQAWSGLLPAVRGTSSLWSAGRALALPLPGRHRGRRECARARRSCPAAAAACRQDASCGGGSLSSCTGGGLVSRRVSRSSTALLLRTHGPSRCPRRPGKTPPAGHATHPGCGARCGAPRTRQLSAAGTGPLQARAGAAARSWATTASSSPQCGQFTSPDTAAPAAAC